MIYVTVGTQLPFDRLVTIVEEWAAANGVPMVAQVGPSKLSFTWADARPFFSPQEAHIHLSKADLVVGHAGMGTILSALELGRPLIIFPRKFALGEHRNDHQMATARKFVGYPGVNVAFDEIELRKLLSQGPNGLGDGEQRFSRFANNEFIVELKKILSEL